MKTCLQKWKWELCSTGISLALFAPIIFFLHQYRPSASLGHYVSLFSSTLAGGFAIHASLLRIVDRRAKGKARPGNNLLKLLEFCRWLFGRESREIVELLIADLKRDRKVMLARGMSPWLIRLLLCCAALRSLLPIALRGLAALLALEELVRKIIGRK